MSAFALSASSSVSKKACTKRQPAKHKSPAARAASHKVAEGFSQNGAQGIFGTKCTLPRSHRCERGKDADNQEHDAARRIAEPGHPLKYGLLAHVLLSSFLSMSMSSSSCPFRLWFGRWHGTARERGGTNGVGIWFLSYCNPGGLR